MSEAKKGSPKIALNMSMVKTIMWDKGPDYTFERVKAAGLSYFELSQVPTTRCTQHYVPPTPTPTPTPSATPTPTATPSPTPTAEPTQEPTEEPTEEPTPEPTDSPEPSE